MEKMKMYEQSYHAQEQKLKASLDRIDQLTQDKENLSTVHYDLVNEFGGMKKQSEEMSIQTRSLRLELDELTG